MAPKESDLANAGYWNDRHEIDCSADEWAKSYDELRPFLVRHLPKSQPEAKILHLGNGTSTLPISLRDDLGYTNQTAVDFSPVLVRCMQQHHADITWHVMDIRNMSTFPDCSFDAAIDKTTPDSLLHGSLLDPEPEVQANLRAYVDEIARVLKPGGVWLYITWSQSRFLRPLLERECWSLEVEVLGTEGGVLEYFGFVVREAS